MKLTLVWLVSAGFGHFRIGRTESQPYCLSVVPLCLGKDTRELHVGRVRLRPTGDVPCAVDNVSLKTRYQAEG